MFAARIKDITAHGGMISSGYPRVLIGGMPAARVTDMHTCALVTVLVPHIGGPMVTGSMTVVTGGMSQSRVGDFLICVGPPDVVAMGCPTVIVGGPTGIGAGLSGLGGFMAAMTGALMAVFSPPYPRSELQPDGSIVTLYSPNVRVSGTPQQQAETMRQLDAVRAGPGGQEFFDGLAERDQPVTLHTIGDPAGGRALHPGQQSYENCAVQASQQIIHQATGNNYDEGTMENIAVSPNDSGYDRAGGTPRPGRETILENGGVPAHMEPGDPANVDRALANNQGVVTSHDAGKLWGDPDYDGSGHAVNTTGAVQDENGETLAYTINDTGTDQAGRVVPAEQYQDSMSGRTVAVTDNPIR